MERYDILTLNARTLMWFSTKNGDCPEYRINLKDSKEGARNFSVISSTEEMGDSPFFYQLLQCSKKPKQFDNSMQIYEDVIFVDFKDCLQFQNKRSVLSDVKKSYEAKEAKKDQTKHLEYIRGFSVGKHLSTLLNSAHGIYITFESGNTVHFVPSDRSSSMAKAGKLAFINEQYLEEMKNRLCLDMDFTKIGKEKGGIQLSKYYAYRGLYLTTSERIIFPEANTLDKNTFIVLDDFKDKPIDGDGKTYFKARKQENSNKHDFYITKELNEELNLYDGEGFICPELTAEINKSLTNSRLANEERTQSFLRNYKQLTSIQIRGPFLKGMCHTVDFNSFFNKYGKPKNGKLLITDVFGVERDLLKAQIIVNKSMFKCTDWLKEYCLSHNIEDPMDYYFRAFYKYDHALYVANAVKDINEDDYLETDDSNIFGVESLNYQFLSTLDITEDDLKKLVDTHYSICDSILKAKYAFDSNTLYSNIPDYLLAAKVNPKFLSDSKIINSLSVEIKNNNLLCGRGKLKTYGEHRYLSSDLVAYLKDILKRTDKNLDLSCISVIDKHSFYAPTQANGPIYNCEIAFERNPHLSRQEEVILQGYVPKEDSLYTQFEIDKLTDLVMFPRASLNFMILSSADVDGDMVMMYQDPIIINAIKRGCYDENMNRKLPVTIIPDEGKTLTMATEEGKPDIQILIDTLSNQVGKISNMAVTFAREEYYGDNKEAFVNSTAKCTILTGLEIDKIKHGFSVAQDINELWNECFILRNRKKRDYFIERKDKITAPDAKGTIVKKADRGDGYILCSYPNDYRALGIKPVKEVSFPLDKLFAYFCEKESDFSKNHSNTINAFLTVDDETLRKYKYHFKFEQETGWKKSLQREKLDKILQLIQAYNQILQNFRNIHRSYEISEATNFHGKALFYLQKRYDGGDLSFIPSYSEDKTVEDLLIEAETIFEENLSDYDSARKTTEKLINEVNWPFIIDKNKRKDVLKSLISNDLPEDILEFLTDFTEEGYYLAYYVLKFVYYRFRTQRPVVEMISQKVKNDYKDNPYWEPFQEALVKAIKNKYTYSKFNKELSSNCLDEIYKLFNNTNEPTDEALKYIFYLVQRNHISTSFMWNVLPSAFTVKKILQCPEENS